MCFGRAAICAFKGNRIVFYSTGVPPQAAGCTLQKFSGTQSTNWQYDCANAFLDGTIRIHATEFEWRRKRQYLSWRLPKPHQSVLLHCSVYGGWRDWLQVRFPHYFRSPGMIDCSYNSPFPVSMQQAR